MSEFFPHALIHRAGSVATLDPAPDLAVAALLVDTRLGPLPLDAYVHHPDSGVDGIVVVRAGRLVYEAYPRMRSFDKHLLMSVSKPFASTLVAILADRGMLDVDTPVGTHLPEVRGSGWDGVVVRDVLDMASGIDCHELSAGADTNPAHPSFRYDASLGLRPASPETPASTYDYVAGLGRLGLPGEAFQYSSANTFILAWLAERVTGRSFNEALAEEIWAKIGAEGDALIVVSPVGAPAAEGGISATLRDVARFGLLFTPSRSVVSADPIVPAWYVEELQRSGRPSLFAAGDGGYFSAPFAGDPPGHNAWQWDGVWPDGDFFKVGLSGQGLYVSPSEDLVVAFFGTRDETGRPNDPEGVVRQLARQLAA
jgi:CubicO group peptidase (beta-lactamase class C family)